MFTSQVDISRFTGEIRGEWEALREHDVIFLVCIDKPQSSVSSEAMSQFDRYYA